MIRPGKAFFSLPSEPAPPVWLDHDFTNAVYCETICNLELPLTHKGHVMKMKQIGCWKLPLETLHSPTARQARDLMIECFFHAQRETLARVKQTLASRVPSDEELHRDIRGMVRLAMKENGDEFESPTVNSLARLLGALRTKASAWGTPDDIVAHHRAQIDVLLTKVRTQAG